jgi:hypothetical protein
MKTPPSNSDKSPIIKNLITEHLDLKTIRKAFEVELARN